MLTVERSKRRIEAITITADFSDRMAASDSIFDATVTIEVFAGDDPSPSDMLYLPIIIDTQAISQRVKLGVVGDIYNVQFSVLTTDGLILDQTTRLAVLPNASGAIPEFMPLYFTSKPYPLLDVENLLVASTPQDGELRQLIIPYSNPEYIAVSVSPLTGTLQSIIVGYTDSQEALQVSAVPTDGSLRTILLSYTDSDNKLLVSAAPRDGTLKQTLIQYTMQPENMLVSGTPLSGTLS